MTYLLLPRWTIKKYRADGSLYETVALEGNALQYGGSSAMWELLLGRVFTPFDNTNAYIGAGTGTSAPDPTHTALQGGSTTLQPMEPGYPLHVPSNTAPTASIIFQANFAPGFAEFDWQEVGLFNAPTAGRMFNRRVENIGVKPTLVNWLVELQFSIEPEAGST